MRFELPAGGEGASGTPVKASSGVGGGGACDAVGVMLPSVTVRPVFLLRGFPQGIEHQVPVPDIPV